MTISGLQAAAAALWVMVGKWLRNMFRHRIYMSITEGKYEKIAISRPGTFVQDILVTLFIEVDWRN